MPRILIRSEACQSVYPFWVDLIWLSECKITTCIWGASFHNSMPPEAATFHWSPTHPWDMNIIFNSAMLYSDSWHKIQKWLLFSFFPNGGKGVLVFKASSKGYIFFLWQRWSHFLCISKAYAYSMAIGWAFLTIGGPVSMTKRKHLHLLLAHELV